MKGQELVSQEKNQKLGSRSKKQVVAKKKWKRLDIREALRLRIEKKLNYAEIARVLKTGETTVYQALKPFQPFFDKLASVPEYEVEKPNILSAIEFRLAQALANEDKINSASLSGVAHAFDKIATANRYIRGQAGTPTINIAIRTDITGNSIETVQQRCIELGIPTL